MSLWQMAYYSAARKCYVSKETNKRYKGLAKHLKEVYFPTFRPPRGLGPRLGPAGYAAGAMVDRAASALIMRKSIKGLPKWSVRLGKKVVQGLRGCRMQHMTTQLVVFCNKRNYATAVDIYGRCPKTGDHILIELKYSSHSCTNLREVYRTPGQDRDTMRVCGKPNTIFEQHAMQARQTALMFSKCYKISKKRIQVAVLVIAFDGSTMFNRVPI